MLDQYGRRIDYIRVSVTDRCNLRCTYCMPAEGIEQVAHTNILTYDEIVCILKICAGKGISKVKLTGGEPLVRKGIADLVKTIKDMEGIQQVTLTTNGVLLADQMEELCRAGLDAVNISLDTLDEEMYQLITRRKEQKAVLRGIEKALCCPQIKVKINCVPLPGVNESQWLPLSELARDNCLDVRFIEMMPIGLGRQYMGSTQEDILKVLRKAYGKETPLSGEYGNGPSSYVHFEGFQGKIGFISAISHKFCSQCNRIRLTAEGYLKPCLQYAKGQNLRTLLRAGGQEEEIGALIEQIIYDKPCCHQFERDGGEGFEERQMSRIGG